MKLRATCSSCRKVVLHHPAIILPKDYVCVACEMEPRKSGPAIEARAALRDAKRRHGFPLDAGRES